MTNQDVLIDGETFEAVSVVELTRESEIVEHPVEGLDGDTESLIPDHIFLKPRVLSVDLRLITAVTQTVGLTNRLDALLFLDNLYQNKVLFSFVCDLGKFDNMVVQSLSVAEDNKSANCFNAKLTLREIVIVISATTTFQYIVDEDGSEYSGAPIPSDTETVVLYKPGAKKEDDPGLWQKIKDGVGQMGADIQEGIASRLSLPGSGFGSML